MAFELFKTCDTVACDTPANRATSPCVGLFALGFTAPLDYDTFCRFRRFRESSRITPRCFVSSGEYSCQGDSPAEADALGS